MPGAHLVQEEIVKMGYSMESAHKHKVLSSKKTRLSPFLIVGIMHHINQSKNAIATHHVAEEEGKVVGVMAAQGRQR